MQLHQVKRKTKNKKAIQVGRGGARGKTSGRGTKGQGARAGRKIRPEIRDRIKKLPKLRGYAFNTIQEKPIAVSIATISNKFENGATITGATLVEKKVISTFNGKIPKVKIVGDKKEFKLDKKFVISGMPVSAQVKAQIEKSGGEVK